MKNCKTINNCSNQRISDVWGETTVVRERESTHSKPVASFRKANKVTKMTVALKCQHKSHIQFRMPSNAHTNTLQKGSGAAKSSSSSLWEGAVSGGGGALFEFVLFSQGKHQ